MSKTTFDPSQASRLNAFSFDPDALYVETDPSKPYYEIGSVLPLKPEFIANVKAMGVIEPVVVRKVKLEDGSARAVVIDGRTRTRGARAANEELRAAGLPIIMVPTVVRAGDEADAYSVAVALNAHRRNDEEREIVMKVQRLGQIGRGPGDIAMITGLSLAKVKEYLDTDVKTLGGPIEAAPPKERKPRVKSSRPTPAAIRRITEREGFVKLSERERLIFQFFKGEISLLYLEAKIEELRTTDWNAEVNTEAGIDLMDEEVNAADPVEGLCALVECRITGPHDHGIEGPAESEAPPVGEVA